MAIHTRLREFKNAVGNAAAAWRLAARGAQPGRLPTIGFLGPNTRSAGSEWIVSLVQRLRELGWIDGRNVAMEYRWGEGREERFAEFAVEFVRLKVDVIVTVGSAVAATNTHTGKNERRYMDCIERVLLRNSCGNKNNSPTVSRCFCRGQIQNAKNSAPIE